MKRFKLFLICFPVLLLTLIPLAGCGIPQSDYDNLQAQKTALESEKQTLQNDYDTLTTEHESLQAEKSTLEAEKQTLMADFDKLNGEYETLKLELNTLQDEKESLQNDYNQIISELTEIKKVYPPREFSSRREFEDWLLTNDVSEKPKTTNAEAWIGRALEVQEDALMDGYIVSVDYDGPDEEGLYLIFCTTVINGYIWYWDPETDEINQDISFIPIN